MTDDLHDFDELDRTMRVNADVRAALAPTSVREGTRSRLLARASADAQARGIVPLRSADTPTIRPERQRAFPIVVAALGFALAASLVLFVRANHERNTLRAVLAGSTQRVALVHDSLHAAIAERDTLLATLTGPDVHVVSLRSTEPTRQPNAMMFWEQRAGQWTFVVHNLAPLASGRTYELWLVTPKRKIPAGTFAVSPLGSAMMRLSYPLSRDSLAAVAVTEEPAGGVPQPTGAIMMVGMFAAR